MSFPYPGYICISNPTLGSGSCRQSGLPPQRAHSSALEKTAVSPCAVGGTGKQPHGEDTPEPLSLALLNVLVCWDDELALEGRLMAYGNSEGLFLLSSFHSLITHIITVSLKW